MAEMFTFDVLVHDCNGLTHPVQDYMLNQEIPAGNH